ncbi:DUF808 domain-containing protein [Thalassotalea marina]|uniref:Membrane protein n=1 Tax=Thalassotalea marina TaxID=1673741 RepID=A0A919BMQ2_9GAMM|nr:DUF808 domain-containing protein [Thalassotalea marina]GHG01715.1 membrane protein [Thalassotalea marina]
MAGANLLALIDDIATILDDVAILSKTAAKKTAGVLGDDLALNAQQVSGVKANREIPVVWAVAKGSFWNKVILVPGALLISALYPPLITVLMVIGGLYLCYEGAEKVCHKLLHSAQSIENQHTELLNKVSNEQVDLLKAERQKIKGAIRTDFILSAEIVVIVLGSVKTAPFETQVIVLSSLALAFTVGVYGLVAAIVKLDDLGLYLLRHSISGRFSAASRLLGRGLLQFAPLLMKSLSVVGTLAMFLVGGGILSHSFSWLHHGIENITQQVTNILGSWMSAISSILSEGLLGLIAGLCLVAIVFAVQALKQRFT